MHLAKVLAFVLLVAACGGKSASNPRVKETVLPPKPEPSSSITVVPDEPSNAPPAGDAFRPTSGPGDVPVPYVRDERSSRLEGARPSGRAREAWHAPLGAPKREPCRGGCSPAEASFVLAAGNRVAVVGAGKWLLFDTDGRSVGTGTLEAPNARLDRASGVIVSDDTRAADLPADAKVASRGGLVVMVKSGGIHIGERTIDGRFDALDLAIDDNGIASVLVRQTDDLLLWTVPLSSSGGIGRYRIGRGRRPIGPPVLGRNLRIVAHDSGIVAYRLDGKRAWERRGLPTGGMSITADDHLLIADDGKILSIDPRGRATEMISIPDVVFVTPPILNAAGMLFVASGEALHALSFS